MSFLSMAIPPGTYAGGARSPIVYVWLCPVCAGYAPTVPGDSPVGSHCQGCGAYVREVHRFQALIMSAANGGCMCDLGHRQVTGDLPTEESALAVWTEVKTRPAIKINNPQVSRPWPYDGPEGRARLTGSLDTGGSFTGDDDDDTEPATGGRLVTCRHCCEPIVRCTEPIQYCKGWKHVAYLHYGPVGPHYCQGRSINPLAEPGGDSRG